MNSSPFQKGLEWVYNKFKKNTATMLVVLVLSVGVYLHLLKSELLCSTLKFLKNKKVF